MVIKKRMKLQALRKVNDPEIIKYMSYKLGEPSLSKGITKYFLYVMNWFALIYCYFVRLKTVEFQS